MKADTLLMEITGRVKSIKAGNIKVETVTAKDGKVLELDIFDAFGSSIKISKQSNLSALTKVLSNIKLGK